MGSFVDRGSRSRREISLQFDKSRFEDGGLIPAFFHETGSTLVPLNCPKADWLGRVGTCLRLQSNAVISRRAPESGAEGIT